MKAETIIAKIILSKKNMKNILENIQKIAAIAGESTSIRLNIYEFHPSEVKMIKIDSIADPMLSNEDTWNMFELS
jgi:hypothetical protein